MFITSFGKPFRRNTQIYLDMPQNSAYAAQMKSGAATLLNETDQEFMSLNYPHE